VRTLKPDDSWMTIGAVGTQPASPTSRSAEPPRKTGIAIFGGRSGSRFRCLRLRGHWSSGVSRASAALRDRSGLQAKSGRISAQRRSADAQAGTHLFVAGIIMTWRRDFAPVLFPDQGARTRSDSPGFTASFTSPSAYGHPTCHPAVGVGGLPVISSTATFSTWELLIVRSERASAAS
jgi:hypothetical protein